MRFNLLFEASVIVSKPPSETYLLVPEDTTVETVQGWLAKAEGVQQVSAGIQLIVVVIACMRLIYFEVLIIIMIIISRWSCWSMTRSLGVL